ncbi:MAG: carboxymuconolactone decarboxylase family protein [Burkholderiales bacterium]
MATKERSKQFKAGLSLRKRVVGPDYVRASLKNTDEFWMPFQELITEHGWGAVWTRPGLPLKTRSMLTLAFCIALNRPNEIKIHLRGAIRNGMTPLEIREMIIHAFLYCGGPASLDAFHVVKNALPEILAAEGKTMEGKSAGRARRK